MMGREINTNSVFVFIFGFISGILVSSFLFIPPILGVLIIFLGLVIFLVEKVWKQKVIKEVLFLSLAVLSFGLGILRYSIKDFHESLTPSSIGVVINEPEQRENTTRFILLADNGEKVLVNTDLYSPVQYGDKVEVGGKLQEPGIIDNEDGGRSFDYASYLSKDDIYYTLNFAKVEIFSSGHGNIIKRALFKIKRSFVQQIKEILTEPYAGLLSGLIVSGKEAMPKDMLEEFRRAGVIHIVVLSGFNLTVIAAFMKIIFRSVRFSVVGIILFVIMTGAQATVVRAAIMVLTVILAKRLGRNFSAPRALLVAAFLMLLHNPKILVFDPSFQLSFLATCGLIILSPKIEKYFHFLPTKFQLRELAVATISTQIFVLPLILYMMGDFSIIAIVVNLLVLMFIPIAMLFGFFTGVLAFLSTAVALPFAYISYFLLSYELKVVDIFSSLPFASIHIPYFPFWLMVFVYASYFIFLGFLSKKEKKPCF